ncbi:polysaccharide deacetylase family protein [Haladaptatus sp. AB643]|uniref:polysaccharide deacetylase family protein n=1 Tax=Haladaptatus sp. AB643 TaxID=2934174 RepID=UPI00209C21AC|nr:polysaccharide deacetylase family protein [Haladaptatus sp. AB643]MCO8245510.1 polysaccharide deacetylase family protein [Haladaptatus sp. AB643]
MFPNEITTRRRLLQLTGAAVTGVLAGCSRNSSKSTSTGTSTSTGRPTKSSTTRTTTETTTEETSKPKLRTDYNSRKRFGEPGTSFDDFEDSSKWVEKRNSVTPDSSISFVGTRSLKLSTDSYEGVTAERRLDAPLDISTHDVSFAFRSETPMDVSFQVYLYDADDNWVVQELRNVTYRPPDVGWFRTCPGVFETSETPPDRRNIVRIKLELGSNNSNGVQAHVDDMRLHPKPDKGYVVLSWDDGDQIYYDEAAPLNDEYGFPAVITMPIEPDKVDSSYFMSVEELRERQENGDEVVVHGSTGDPFATISTKKLEHILRRNKQWMIDNGFEGANFIVYPGNNYDKTALRIISKYFYMGGMNQSASVNMTGVHGFDPLVLPRTIGSRLEVSKRAVTLAAEHRQCSILNFHNFDSHNTMSRSEYKELLAHIDGTNGIEVITYSDLWEMRRSRP